MTSISSIFNFKRKQVKLDNDSQINDFRRNAKLCTDYICDMRKKILKKRVFPNVRPGYLRPLLPSKKRQKTNQITFFNRILYKTGEPPAEGEDFKEMLSDFDKLIIPGT